MWGIDSKAWNNIKIYLYSSRVHYKEFLFLGILHLFVYSILLQISFERFILLLFATLVVYLFVLIIVGKQRHNELIKIQSTINQIRLNKIISPDEIKLGRNLLELEGEIKSMFFRTMNDISNLKKLEQIRSEFMGNVSHELRTPIFAIQGYIETLLNGAIKDDNVNKSFLTKANNHTKHLNNLLHDLIDISMIESGQMKMSFRFFTLKDFIQEIINDMMVLAEEKKLQLSISKIRNNLQVFGDKHRIKQVIVNLLSNAIKYTEQGKVEIIVIEHEKDCEIRVSDTGIGIPEKDIERLFERFFRVDKGRSRAIGGTGLGLAIVKHITEAHGTRVKVESKLGEGSSFSFYLKK